jgi:hypothetical protein
MIAKLQLYPEHIEKARFKQTSEGWLFTITDPWIFFRRRTYQIGELNKSAIVARIRRGRVIQLFVVAPALIILVALVSNSPSLKTADLPEATVFTATITIVYVILSNVIEYLSVKPLLRDLPLRSHRLPWSEALFGDYETTSAKALLVWALLCGFAAALGIFRFFTSEHVSSFGVLSTISIGVVAIAKTRTLIARFTRAPRH